MFDTLYELLYNYHNETTYTMENKMSKTMKILVGIPGSGKTTFRNKLVTEQGAVYTNMDELRTKHAPILKKEGRNKFEKFVAQEEQKELRKLLADGKSLVVVDDTHLTMKGIEHHERLGAEYGYKVEVVFMEDSFDVVKCHKRNTSRPVEQHVPVYVVEEMAERFLNVHFQYHTRDVVVKKDREKAIICDLDGTLCHFNGRGPFEWHRVGEDTKDEVVSDLIDFYKSTGHVILMTSARDGVCYDLSKGWLERHNVPFDELIMKPENDNRKDVIVKMELYIKHIYENYDVKVAIDDRNVVCKLWRAVGLKCLQVNHGLY